MLELSSGPRAIFPRVPLSLETTVPLRHLWRRHRTVGALLLMIAATVPASACLNVDAPDDTPSVPANDTYAASLGVNIDSMTKLSDDLYYKDIVVGTGDQVGPGNQVTATYTGWLTTGAQFDSNVGGTPYPFVLGAQTVIPGWDLGIPGMHVGGKRRLVIGSNLAYGRFGYGAIPPNSTIVFDVTLVSSE